MNNAYLNWQPPVNSGELTLLEVYDTLPGRAQEQINFLVRLLENPTSPVCLSGAIDLFNHGRIHIILNCGLSRNDEARVIGFTMGNDTRLQKWELCVFEFFARYIYPTVYRFNQEQIEIFRNAVALGRSNPIKNIHQYDFKSNLNKTIRNIRDEWQIMPNFIV